MRLAPPGAAFLDRDGTINVKAPAGEYITDPDDLVLLPGAGAAIRALNRAGVLVVVVTNQRGVALGILSEDQLASVHARMRELLAAERAAVDAFFSCPHGLGACRCRKPHPGLLLDAHRRYPQIDLPRSIMIGDAPSDVAAGRAAGVPSVQLASGLTLLDAVSAALGVPATDCEAR